MYDVLESLMKYLSDEIDQDELDETLDNLANYQIHLMES